MRNTDYHLFTKSGTVHLGGPSTMAGWFVLACTGRSMRRPSISTTEGPVNCKACISRYGASS